MAKHKVFIYTRIDDAKEGEFDYADGGGPGLFFNDRPMVGDVIVQLEDGYPYETLVIKTLIMLREELMDDDDTIYWHAYCDSVGFDYSLQPYYGKSGDIPKLAAHAADQRADFIEKYGYPQEYHDRESYRDKCEDGIKESKDRFWKEKKN